MFNGLSNSSRADFYRSRLSFSFSISLLIFFVLLRMRILNFSMYSIPYISTDTEDFDSG